MRTDEEIIDDLIEREGGFVDHSADRGGPTKFGITQRTLSLWRGRGVSADEVRELSLDEARDIYWSEYVRKPNFDQIQDAPLRALLIDYGVNSGPAKAAMSLQAAIGASMDGIIGPRTLATFRGHCVADVYLIVLAERFRYLGRIITDRPANAAFAAGWMNRVVSFLEPST